MKRVASLLTFTCLALSPLPAYGQGNPSDDNAEISALFKADQSVRENIKPEQFKDRAFVTQMIANDRTRRDRAHALLEEGKLKTADDFYRAAFIFQHGNTANDYLLAHSLALAATARGNKDAPWIAAATLDRYLQTIGQKQIYGTQYLNSR